MNRPHNGPFPPSANPSTASLLPANNVPGNKRMPPAMSVPSRISDIKSAGGRSSVGHPPSLSDKYSLSPSPASWGMPLLMSSQESDDYLHNPDPRRDRRSDTGGSIFTLRGLANLGCLSILALGMLMLFAGYPMMSHFLEKEPTTNGGFNLGGINATGQIPDLPGNFGLIDKDTPQEAYTIQSYQNADEELVLVFSDEFNQDDRTFYPGDDPFWEAVDLHYWGTNNLEWYDPQQATTGGGNLRLTIEKVANPEFNHNMEYKSGMIQTWNKFCFTGGLLLSNVQLPGSSDVAGMWPAVWTMGNLARAGFGASTEGLWPFSYDSCDVGTLPNQTYPGERRPEAAFVNGDGEVGGVLSYLPGQRLSACTCPGESHPGPMRKDGSYVGRSSPEIDALEATVTDGIGHVSLSAQFAPFNAGYLYIVNNQTTEFYDPDRTVRNPYLGGRYQMTTSGLGLTNPNCYERPGTCFALFGFEYKPGFDNAYITWINEVKAWTVYSSALVADSEAEIDQRMMPLEPMYIITNLGISEGFGDIDTANLVFPSTMLVDYIRIYQPKNAINIGCDPKDFPTAAYIETYKEAYTNPNFTIWSEYGQPWPKNRLQPGGCD